MKVRSRTVMLQSNDCTRNLFKFVLSILLRNVIHSAYHQLPLTSSPTIVLGRYTDVNFLFIQHMLLPFTVVRALLQIGLFWISDQVSFHMVNCIAAFHALGIERHVRNLCVRIMSLGKQEMLFIKSCCYVVNRFCESKFSVFSPVIWRLFFCLLPLIL